MTITSHSQPETRQDLAVAEYFLNRRGGYFLDVGAYDGQHFSNSYALEKDLGWTGICVEPIDYAFAGLRGCRSCVCVQAAAYSEDGIELDFVDGDVLAGIDRHIDRWAAELTDRRRYKVKTRSLRSLMVEHKSPAYVDYLSIDTEGSELEVLRGIDWSSHTFGYITLEHNFVEPRRAEMRAFLVDRGYRYVRENAFDDDYASVRT